MRWPSQAQLQRTASPQKKQIFASESCQMPPLRGRVALGNADQLFPHISDTCLLFTHALVEVLKMLSPIVNYESLSRFLFFAEISSSVSVCFRSLLCLTRPQNKWTHLTNRNGRRMTSITA